MEIVRTLDVDPDPAQVFAYLSDFTTSTEWDAGTVRTTREPGDGGGGTRYRNISRFRGRETELTYVTEELTPPRRLRFRGENNTVIADDTITLEPTASGGTRVHYRAEFRFRGLARLAAPFLGRAFEQLGDDAEASLRAALERL